MAVTNPSLLSGFDINNTNLSIPASTILNDGYVFQDILLSSNHNYILNQIFKNLNFLMENGGYQFDSSKTYKEGAKTIYLGDCYTSKVDANSGNTPTVKGESSFWKWDNEETNKLRTPRTISLSGNATGSISFDGTSDATINTTVTDSEKLDGKYSSEFVQTTGSQTISGVKTFNGNEVIISGSTPRLKLYDTSLNDTYESFWLYANSGDFTILTDRDNDGWWENPSPLLLSNSTSKGYLYENEILAVQSMTFGNTGKIVFTNGFAMIWGRFSSTTDSPQTINFHTAFTDCDMVQLGGFPSGSTVNFTNTGFTVDRINTVDGSPTYSYLAFGKI